MTGFTNFMDMMVKGFPDLKEDRKDALRDIIKGRIVDTCFTRDTGKWETGIQDKNGQFIIVEIYENSKEEAIKCHGKWVAKFKKNPEMKLKKVGFEDWAGL